jgi:benzodiazapine receptor
VHASTVRRHQAAWEPVLAAVIFAVATIAVAALGNVATSSGRDWYDSLERPSFTPPDATFGIVWSVLYVMIAVAGWLAWRATDRPAPTVWWGVQMALNLLWTVVFFGLQAPGVALAVIAALIVAAGIDLQVSVRASTAAGVLLFPYVMWCGFAAALNVGVVALN